MAVTREQFEQGMTAEAYRAQMTRNEDRYDENLQTVQFAPEDVAFFRDLPEPLNVVVITEDWCGDAVANVPVLVRLAEESGTLNLRLFLRDQNPELMDQYLNQGVHRSIPTFAFFDNDFHELGHWTERPAVISEQMNQKLGELFSTNPAFAGVAPGTSPALLPEEARMAMGQFFGTFRAGTRSQSDREVVREIRALVQGARETDGA